MTYEIDMQTKLWLRELEKKLGRKLEAECLRLGSIMPYVPERSAAGRWQRESKNGWTEPLRSL